MNLVNTTLLREKIEQSGYKMGYITEQLGITHQGLLNKLNEESDFKVSEAMILKDLLKLSDEDVSHIFFAEGVA